MIKTATLATDSGNTTLTLEYTASSAVMLEYATAWAKYDWRHGYGDHGTEEEPIEFDSLTNQEKVNLVLERVFQLGKDEAIAQIRHDAVFDPAAQADITEIEEI